MAASSDGDVASSISGGHQDNVVIARDISGPITITAGGARTPRYLQDPDNWPLARAWEALAAGAHRTRLGDDGSAVPPYVARDQDTLLRERIMQAAEHGGLVLVVGDSTAGKTRAACEAVRAVLPDHRILAPACGEDVPWAVDVAARTGVACVVWLDDLENFVGPQELEPALLAELVRLRIPVVATMRTQQYDTFNPQAHDQDSPHDPASSKRALAVGARVLNLTEPVELQRLWTGGELARAADCDDSRVIDALTHHGPYGIAEYLAAGPALLHQWRRANRAGGHPRGAALVAAAVDLTRTGLRPPYHLDVLAALHQSYLDQAGGPLLRPESLDEALSWAGDVRYGVTSLLLPTADPGAWTVFDYLVDQTFTAIPEDVWEAALTHAADASDRFTVGVHAYSVAPHIAEAAWLPLAHSANPAVAYNLGNLLTNLGRVAEAETYYRQALDAGDTHAANNLGNLLTNLGRVAEAETYYRQALDAGDTHAANNLGNLLTTMGRVAEAETYFGRALDAGNPNAAFNLGFLLAKAGRATEAETYYRRALDTGDTKAAFNLGNLLVEAGRDAEAETYYRRALDTGDTTAANNLGFLLAKAGRATEAETYYRQALDAGDTKAAFNLGNLLTTMGRVAEAETYFRRALDVGDTAAAFNLGFLLAKAGRTTEAETYYRQALDAGHAAAAFNLGNLLAKAGRGVEAETLYRQALDTGDTTAANNLGFLLAKAGRATEAETYYRQALDAGDTKAAFNLGILLEKAGRDAEAETYYRQALDAGHTEAAFNLGFLLAIAGRFAEAETLLGQAVQGDG